MMTDKDDANERPADMEIGLAAASALPEQQMHSRQEQEPEGKTTPAPGSTQADAQLHPVIFSGRSGEYFRIWIANLFLSIVTLGIYAAWAKVRTRRYFYANTKLTGHVFDYLATPGAILRGNLIIGGGALLYNLGVRFNPLISLAILAFFALILPFLIYKSLRYFSRYSSFRNIRFRFLGSLKESYRIYLFYPLLLPLTLGFILPYWTYRRKRYFYDNLAFGTTTNFFFGRPGYFYKIYGCALAMIIGIGIASSLGIASLTPLVHAASGWPPAGLPPQNKMLILASVAGSYAVMLLMMTIIQQYLYVRTSNYCWARNKLGPMRFVSTLKVRKLVGICLSNLAAIIFSLGLLTPWAKIRRTRYVLDNLRVRIDGDLDHFQAAAASEESAIGEAAADYFNFEIAL
ncbi:MAG: YjgN family protein [Deltaproteobacteria bacterium]